MFTALKCRRPWAATVIAVLLGPGITMLYLGKGRAWLVYLAAGLLPLPPLLLLIHVGLLPVGPEPVFAVLGFGIWLFGIVHAWQAARGLAGRLPEVWFARWHWLAAMIAVPWAAATLFKAFAWQPFDIASASMVPTLMPGDTFFVAKAAYGYSRYSMPFDLPLFAGRVFAKAPEPGDVVVFRLPKEPHVAFVKRIVAGPGEQVRLRNGVLHINGVPVDRKAVGEFSLPDGEGGVRQYRKYIEILPNGRWYDIAETTDSGPLDNTETFVVPDGHWFVLGDSRDSSMDSRVLSEVGYVPEENLVGRISWVYWNSRSRRLVFLDR